METLNLLHIAVRHEIKQKIGNMQWPITIVDNQLDVYILHGVMTAEKISTGKYELRSRGKKFIEVKFKYEHKDAVLDHDSIEHIKVEPAFVTAYIGIVRMTMNQISEWAMNSFEDEIINRK